ncbi:MAG: hypothetical protein C0592_04640 [Marinilabiliales bacterium]|nr:MAG: hypothetical protein C0592_04640 [Marinilabiliales bacterium]
MKHLIYILLVVFLAACGNKNQSDQENAVNENNDSIAETNIPEIDPINDEENKPPYYIIAVKAFAEKDSAILFLEDLRKKYNNANYLFIPDYKSLSGKEMYQVFLGPYSNEKKVIPALMDYKESNNDAYAVLVDHNTRSRSIYSPYDIRQNGNNVKQIFIYAEPSAENEYYESGGEDWGWFVNDVGEYYSNHHPEVEFFYVYNDVLRQKDIASIEAELDLEDSFGYILINNGKKSFIYHDLPETVIDQANSFFGFPGI